MAELEERPSKIRKTESSDGSSEPFQGNSSSMDLLNELPNGQAESAVSQAPPTGENPPLSKSQLKKLKKAAHWEAGKEYRRTLRREKHKEKQARKAKEREEINEKVAKSEMERPVIVRKPGPRRPIQVPVSFVLDCDFNDLMMEKEIISLGAQLTRCYSDNKCNPYRAHLSVSSWGGTLQKRFETVLTNNHQSWKGIRFFEEGFEAAAEELHRVMRGPGGGKLVGALGPKSTEVQNNDTSAPSPNSGPDAIDPAAQLAVEVTEVSSQSNGVIQTPEQPLAEENLEIKQEGSQDTAETGMEPASVGPKSEPFIVYLTSDSPNTLDFLSPYTTYIIGGIVDKNRHKGLCYKRACERGIPTARLPIGEFMTMQSRTVLTVNHVMEIMLKWLETGDWGEAFLKVIPKRKEAKLRVKNGGGSTVEQEQQGEESDDHEQSEVGGSLDVVNGKSNDEE